LHNKNCRWEWIENFFDVSPKFEDCQRSLRWNMFTQLTSLSADRLLWSSTVGWAVLWSTCVGVDWLLSDAMVTAVFGLMVCVELLTGLEAKTGVLLTGGCCFFLSAS
jgi:hypothetical protein